MPDGKYPFTFITTGNTWTGGEEVAVQIGSEVKQHTAAVGEALTVARDGTTFYWTNRTMNMSAWHAATYLDAKPETFSVAVDQGNESNYQNSDMLHAYQNITFNASTSPSSTCPRWW